MGQLSINRGGRAPGASPAAQGRCPPAPARHREGDEQGTGVPRWQDLAAGASLRLTIGQGCVRSRWHTS